MISAQNLENGQSNASVFGARIWCFGCLKSVFLLVQPYSTLVLERLTNQCRPSWVCPNMADSSKINRMVIIILKTRPANKPKCRSRQENKEIEGQNNLESHENIISEQLSSRTLFCIWQSTLYTPHSTLYIPLYTPHSPHYTPHPALHTLHSSEHRSTPRPPKENKNPSLGKKAELWENAPFSDTHLPYLLFVKHNDRYQGRLSQLSQATFFSQLRLEKNFCKMLRHVASYHENPWNLLVFIKRLGLITKIIQNPRICGCLKVGNRIPDGLCLWSNGNGEQILHFETKPGESLFARNQPLLGGSSDQSRQWLNL